MRGDDRSLPCIPVVQQGGPGVTKGMLAVASRPLLLGSFAYAPSLNLEILVLGNSLHSQQ